MWRRRYHLPLLPGTNVAVLTALAHVIVTEGLVNEAFVRERCDWDEFQRLGGLRRRSRATARKQWRRFPACRRRPSAPRRGSMPPAATRAIYYGLGVTEHSQGSTTRDGDRQPRHGDRQYRPARRRRESAARPEQRAGLLRHGLVPARAVRLSPHLRRRDARDVRGAVGRAPRQGAGPAHPQHARCRGRWLVQGHLRPGRGHPAVRPRHASMSRPGSRRWNASWCRTCS